MCGKLGYENKRRLLNRTWMIGFKFALRDKSLLLVCCTREAQTTKKGNENGYRGRAGGTERKNPPSSNYYLNVKSV